jgi:methionyl aminopeptidase
MISLKSKREIEILRFASKIISHALAELEKAVKPGVTTHELDQIAEDVIKKSHAIPAFKGYRGFPATICASVNSEVVHGIPSGRKLADGDIISVDVGVKYEGYYSDAARTLPVGSISKEAARLISVTRDSFYAGIDVIKPGARLGDVSYAIQTFIEKNGFSVVKDFVGHGIGSSLHEDPQIPNFGVRGTGPLLENGMTLAIEPMVNAGTWRVEILDDDWTVVTADNSLSAHYENTILIENGRAEVLT